MNLLMVGAILGDASNYVKTAFDGQACAGFAGIEKPYDCEGR